MVAGDGSNALDKELRRVMHEQEGTVRDCFIGPPRPRYGALRRHSQVLYHDTDNS